ncbi:hypothetical protein ACLOJK_000101 [Asimina triloba]
MDMSVQLQPIATLLIIALAIFLYKLYKPATSTAGGKKVKAPPEPKGRLPILGHLLMLGGDEPLPRKLGSLADEYGPAFVLRLGSRPALVISTWELTRECFTTNDKALAARPKLEVGTQMSYNNAMLGFAPEGAYWRDLRKITVRDLLSPRRLHSLRQVRAAEVHLIMKDLYGLWEKNGEKAVKVEMSERFGDLTFNVIAMMVIGKSCFGRVGEAAAAAAGRFREAVKEWFHLFGIFVPADVFPFLKWWDLRGYKKEMRRIFHVLDTLLTEWLEEHRRKKVHVHGDGDGDGVGDDDERQQDFLDVLIANVDGSQFTDYDVDTIIKATTLTAIIAGYDTTWISSTWTLSLLLNNRETIRKAQEELDKQVGRDRNVEESDLNNLIYLQAIIKESLRLYPSAPLSGPHESTEDCYVGGYFIPAGTRLLVNLSKLHRDPRVWSEPEEFRPERFLTEHADVEGKGKHFQYLPFGAGRRMCPGYIMAHQLLQLTFARLLHGFELRSVGDEPVDMTEASGLTAPKATPLEVLLSPRLPLELYQ